MIFQTSARRFVKTAIAIAGLSGLLIAVPASAASVTKTYTGGLDASEGSGDAYACNTAGVADACFAVKSTVDPKTKKMPFIKIVVTDTSGQPVPVRVFEYDTTTCNVADPTAQCSSDSNSLMLICGTGMFQLAAGDNLVDVRVGPVGRGVVNIPPTGVPDMACGQPEPVTTGTITVSGAAVLGGFPSAPARSSVSHQFRLGDGPTPAGTQSVSFRQSPIAAAFRMRAW